MREPASKMVPIVRSFYKPLPCCNVTKMPVRVPNAQRANTTKTSEFGAQKGLLQGPGKWWVPYALKTPTPQKFSAEPFSRKGVRGTNVLVSNQFSFPKKGHAKECSTYWTTALISHASIVMLKTVQARLQQYVNWELPVVQAGLEKAEEPDIKFPRSAGS